MPKSHDVTINARHAAAQRLRPSRAGPPAAAANHMRIKVHARGRFASSVGGAARLGGRAQRRLDGALGKVSLVDDLLVHLQRGRDPRAAGALRARPLERAHAHGALGAAQLALDVAAGLLRGGARARPGGGRGWSVASRRGGTSRAGGGALKFRRRAPPCTPPAWLSRALTSIHWRASSRKYEVHAFTPPPPPLPPPPASSSAVACARSLAARRYANACCPASCAARLCGEKSGRRQRRQQ